MQVEDVYDAQTAAELPSIPKYMKWLRLRKGDGLLSRTPDRVLAEIDGLVQNFNARASIVTVFHLYMATDYWSRRLNRQRKEGARAFGPEGTVHFTGRDRNRTAVEGLRDTCRAILAAHLEQPDDFGAALMAEFGRPNSGRAGDALALQTAEMEAVYLHRDEQEEQRHRYKLRFRDGLACRWSNHEQAYCPYDTFLKDPEGIESNMGQNWGPGFRHFVMDDRGRIYSGFPQPFRFLFWHSSLVGGEDAYSAGVMRVRHGRILAVVNDSGHYTPGAKQMINLLRRLRLYGAETDRIVVYRHVPDGAAVGAGLREPDFCTGGDLLKAGDWPTKMRKPKE